MADRRRKNIEWTVAENDGRMYGRINGGCVLALLMDIRDELQRLNTLLHCQNFTSLPQTVRSIRRAMPVRKRTRRKRQ